jgi:hypothetical protein
MSLGDKIIIFREIIDHFENEFYPDISGAVIPFSNVGTTEKCQYIYHGHEKIPFNKRHPTYQKIFIHEFLHGLGISSP